MPVAHTTGLPRAGATSRSRPWLRFLRAVAIGVVFGGLSAAYVAQMPRRAGAASRALFTSRASHPLSAEEAKKQELLRLNAHLESDPELASEYQAINTRYFDGRLPPVRIRWEARLNDVGPLISDQFRLEGLTDSHLILLNPTLHGDAPGLRRVLCHEMVHVEIWDRHDEHGPLFQASLRRLLDLGAFDGIVATEEERAQLLTSMQARARTLDEEGASIASARTALDADVAAAQAEIDDLNARTAAANQRHGGWPPDSEREAIARRARELQERTTEHNARVARFQSAIADYNQLVERYNLMASYPDGLDRQRLTRRALPEQGK